MEINTLIEEIIEKGSCTISYTEKEMNEGKRIIILRINEYFKYFNIKIIVTSNHIGRNEYYDKIYVEESKELNVLKRFKKIKKIKNLL